MEYTLSDLTKIRSDAYSTLLCSVFEYKNKDKSIHFRANVSYNTGSSATLGVCGSIQIRDLAGSMSDIKASDHFTQKGAFSYIDSWKVLYELNENKLLSKIRDHLLTGLSRHLANTYDSTLIGLLGRVNIPQDVYTTRLGVYTGSFGRFLAKNKYGTITCSHLHQNKIHATVGDYSIVQAFFWTPPKGDAFVNKSFSGIYSGHDKEEVLGKERKRLNVGEEWKGYIPAYFRRTPFSKHKQS